MAWEQHYYTSCESGRLGSAGFQTNAASAGLTSSVIDILEKWVLYKPPLSYPSHPDADQLATFPKALAFRHLPDGRIAIGLSQFVGEDNIGRWGNFFTHTVIGPPEDLGDLLPVQLWGSPIWIKTPSNTYEIPPLGAFPAGAGLDPAAVGGFVREEDRSERLAQMLGALTLSETNKRRIIIVDRDENVARWVAAVSRSLPRVLALKVTFCTYAENPARADAWVTGIISDSDFAFSVQELNQQFYVFDFEQGRNSPTPARTAFADFAAAAFRDGHFEPLQAFRAWLEQIQGPYKFADLDFLLTLFGVVTESRAKLSEQIIAGLLQFDPGFLKLNFRHLISSFLAGIDPSPPTPTLAAAVDGFYLRLTEIGPDQPLLREIQTFYLQWISRWILPSAGPGELEVLGQVLKRAPLPPRMWQENMELLRANLSKVGDVELALGLIGFIARQGLLPDLQEPVMAIFQRALLDRLDSPSVQPAVATLFEAYPGPEIARDLCHHLMRSNHLDDNFVRITALLTNPAIKGRLLEASREAQCSRLHIALTSFPVSPGETRIARLERVARVFPLFQKDDTPPQLAEYAYALLWDQTTPAQAEVAPIIKILKAPVLDTSLIPYKLWDGLIKTLNLEAVPECREALNAIRSLTVIVSEAENRVLLEDLRALLQAMGKDPRPSLLPAALKVWPASKLAQPEAVAARNQVLSIICRELLFSPDDPGPRHQKALAALAADLPRFMAAYIQQLARLAPVPEEGAGKPTAITPGRFLQLASCWSDLVSSPGPSPLEKAMGELYRRFSREDRQAMEARAEADEHLRKIFAKWAQADPPRVLSRLKGLFFGEKKKAPK